MDERTTLTDDDITATDEQYRAVMDDDDADQDDSDSDDSDTDTESDSDDTDA